MSCKYCDDVVDNISKSYPKCDWNCDEACQMWGELSRDIPNNNIEFDEYSDESYSCTCPSCGEIICGWCV